MKNLLFVFFILLSNYSTAQLVINEVCAANYDDYLPTGNNDDWFELYNTGAADIDLQGYYLSDDIADPTKYQVPSSITLAAGSNLVIFASGKDGIIGGSIHCNFKITQAKQEYVVLSNPAGSIIDTWWLDKANQKNHSFGRITDGASTWGIFTDPSPGSSNSGSFVAYADKPIFSVNAGSYSSSVTVSITPLTATGDIKYTLDGSVPNTGSPSYTGPINISSTSVLRARNFSADPSILPSFIETNTYFIDVNHSLKILSICGDQITPFINDMLGFGDNYEGSIEYFDSSFSLIDEGTGDFNKHGNDSWAYPQRGFDFIMRDQYGHNNVIHDEIFDQSNRGEFQRIIVKAAANDNYPFSDGGAHIRDAYIHEISQRAGLKLDERSTESCVLYIDGEYWGVYDIREKVDDLDYTKYYYDQGEGEVDFIKTWGGTWNEYGNGDGDWDALVNYVTSNDMSVDANYQYVKTQLNTGSLIDYFILNSYVVAADWLNWNTEWWRGLNPSGDHKKWGYVLWDMDNTFGHGTNYTGVPSQDPNADPCNPETLGNPGGQGHVPILNALFDNEEFYQDYVSRYADLSAGSLSCASLNALLDEMISDIAPEMPGQIARWGGDISTWENNVQEIRDFIDARCQVIADGIVDCYDVEGPFDVTVIVQPPGAGEVDFNSIEINTFPWTGQYFGGLNVDLNANALGTNIFSHWELNNHTVLDPNNEETSFAFEMSDTIIAYFVTTTTDLTLEVEPDGAGDIDFLSNNYTSFPTTVETPEDVDLDIVTSASGSFFQFDRWELSSGTLTDGDTPDATININGICTVKAVYIELENYNITIISEGADGTTITFNDIVIDDSPYSDQFLANVDYTISAEAPEHFHFVNWTLNNNSFSNDPNLSNSSFTLTDNDTLVAHFEEDLNYNLTIKTEPPEAGKLFLNSTEINTLPHTQKYYIGEFDIDILAQAYEHHDFIKWTSLHHDLGSHTESEYLGFVLSQSDTITANFYIQPFNFWLPNAFSPNEDGINDIFRAHGSSVDVEEYEMLVFDRLGQVVFQTQDFNIGWNGSGLNSPEYYNSDGAYTYIVKVKSAIDKSLHEYYGIIAIVR